MDFTNSQNEGYQNTPAIMLVSNSRRCLNLVEQSVGAASAAICAVKSAASRRNWQNVRKQCLLTGTEHWTYRTYLPALTANAMPIRRPPPNFFSYEYNNSFLYTYTIYVYSLFSPLPPLPPRSARGIPSGARYPYVRYSLKARVSTFKRVPRTYNTYIGMCTTVRCDL